MKILGLVASPQRGGNVDQLVDGVLGGASEGGADVEKVNVSDFKVERCRSCLRCRKTHVCDLADDVAWLFDKIARAGAVVVALRCTGPTSLPHDGDP